VKPNYEFGVRAWWSKSVRVVPVETVSASGFADKIAGVLSIRGVQEIGTAPFPFPRRSFLIGTGRQRATTAVLRVSVVGGAPKSSSLSSVIPPRRDGRCEIRTGSYVREIPVDKSGRVTGVIYFGQPQAGGFQKPKAWCSAANRRDHRGMLLLSHRTVSERSPIRRYRLGKDNLYDL